LELILTKDPSLSLVLISSTCNDQACELWHAACNLALKINFGSYGVVHERAQYDRMTVVGRPCGMLALAIVIHLLSLEVLFEQK